jgi:hypothetical protein
MLRWMPSFGGERIHQANAGREVIDAGLPGCRPGGLRDQWPLPVEDTVYVTDHAAVRRLMRAGGRMVDHGWTKYSRADVTPSRKLVQSRSPEWCAGSAACRDHPLVVFLVRRERSRGRLHDGKHLRVLQ